MIEKKRQTRTNEKAKQLCKEKCFINEKESGNSPLNAICGRNNQKLYLSLSGLLLIHDQRGWVAGAGVGQSLSDININPARTDAPFPISGQEISAAPCALASPHTQEN